ncbi:MAG: alpha/beta hydrolase [Chloroflexi bacterium]|nr:alpha/beta hydrolase [Chloroflexota bacterium]
MGEYVELPGVKTWYEVEGKGEPLVLLHGGLLTNETWGPMRPELAGHFHVFLPERRAHGHTPDVEGPLTYTDMAKDTIDFLTSVVSRPAHLVGWSDGGIVGLLVTFARPDLVKKLVVIGANFEPALQVTPGAEAMMDRLTPDSPDVAMFRALYEAASPDGPQHWPTMLAKFRDMVLGDEPNISRGDLGRISAPTLVMVGDDDLPTLEHTIALYRAIPNSELAVVQRASHALPMEKPSLVNQLIIDFLTNEPVTTLMPIRRAVPPAS